MNAPPQVVHPNMTDAEWQARCATSPRSIASPTSTAGPTPPHRRPRGRAHSRRAPVLPDQQLRRSVPRDHRVEPGEDGYRRQRQLRRRQVQRRGFHHPWRRLPVRTGANCVLHSTHAPVLASRLPQQGLRPITQDALSIARRPQESCSTACRPSRRNATRWASTASTACRWCWRMRSSCDRRHACASGRAAPHVHARARLPRSKSSPAASTRSRRRSSPTSTNSNASAPAAARPIRNTA